MLLGDLLELRHGPLRDALGAAEQALREIGAALGRGREAIVLTGNHDHALFDGWAARRDLERSPADLGRQAAVRWLDGDAMAHVAALLAPATVRAAYPGVWLRHDVYATHGHYLDLHLTVPTLERLATGVMRRVAALDTGGPRRAEDYELVLAPLYAWIHALAQRVGPERGELMHGGSVRGWRALTDGRRHGVRRRAAAAAWPVAVAALNALRLGPLRPELSGAELRRAGLRAMAEVVERLGVGAEWVIFGHTHRAGPLEGDDPSEWRAAAAPGSPGPGARLVNCGCWVRDPAFLGPEPARSPYRPGFCAIVEDDGPPRLVNLLDD